MTFSDLQQIKEKELASQKKIVLRCCMAAGCMSSDAKGVKEELDKAVAAAGLQDSVEVRGVGCMKLCCEGPLVQADPAKALYVKVSPQNAPAISISNPSPRFARRLPAASLPAGSCLLPSPASRKSSPAPVGSSTTSTSSNSTRPSQSRPSA